MEETGVGWVEAVVETLQRDTLEAVSDASSSLSVSPKSKGGFSTGVPSRKSKGIKSSTLTEV